MSDGVNAATYRENWGNPQWAATRSMECRGCGKQLLEENAWMEDGCPCNSPKGCNDGNQLISDWRQDKIQSLQHELARMKHHDNGS